jgi:TolB-like protein/class 3 adenylate cyclase
MDLVESVRLMAANEPGVVGHWHRFLHHARTVVLPERAGRLVKSLGDGILAEFERPSHAVLAALDLHRFFEPTNRSLPAAEQLHLRAGINATHIYVDANDVYGHGVNLAARVADLAAPGETVITASVHDQLVDGVDGDLEDMGESYLKHWPEPVRTWQVRPVSAQLAGARPRRPEAPLTDFRPTIAVIPFESRSLSPEHFVIGDLIADGVITQLSRSQDLRVISRLSTAAFRGRNARADEIDAGLDASFVLSGSYFTHGDRVVIMAELTHARRNETLWAERLSGDTADLLQDQSELLQQLAGACARHLLDAEVQRTLTLALPRLDSSALMLGGITLMHRSTRRDLERSFVLLEAVVHRHKRVATPWAWLAKWHVMQVAQGLTADPSKEFRSAIDLADRALDLEPSHSLAMAVKGHALCHLGSDLDASRRCLTEATQSNPNDAMAWLYLGFWACMWGDASEAVSASETALGLSPLDPQRYYLQMLAANSYLAAQRHEEAISLAQMSLRTNRFHLPTLRALLVAQFELGRTQDAHLTLNQLLGVQPDFTLSKYLSYGKPSALRSRIYSALQGLGVPDQ